MRIEQLLEAPLPDDWDKAIYDTRIPFTQRVRYAKERAEQVGRGSSRVAFKIPYKGRPTVLKIATNRKGMVQNQEETNLLGDWYLKDLEITIPMIDYDEENPQPTWMHTEYATKINQKQLEQFFGGVSMHSITMYLDGLQGRMRHVRVTLPEHIHENEHFQSLQDLVLNFGIPAGDLSRKANWGVYKNKPVIIDLGYTDVTAAYY